MCILISTYTTKFICCISVQDMERARGCFRHLKTIFQELEECRAFELLSSQKDRTNYLMTKQVP